MSNREVTIFYDETGYTFTWLKALLSAQNEFLEYGIKIRFAEYSNFRCNFLSHNFSYDYYEKIFTKKKYDIVFLAYHHSTSDICLYDKKKRNLLLEKLKNNSKLVVWLDTADSTGTCMFDVLPYVDFYLKKQLLKDISRYEKQIWGGRTFCDFYHNQYELKDESIGGYKYSTLDRRYIDKVRLSWNVGLGDLFVKNKFKKFLLQNVCLEPCYVSPKKTKCFDVHYKGSQKYPVVHYQRFKTKELLKKRNDIYFPDIESRVPYRKYVEEIKKSRNVISPFGWGEVCTRDFEAFAFGATLLKNDMEHLITYPQWYVKDKTYVSIDWDFQNFNQIMDNIKNNKKYYQEIAENGQNILKKYRKGDFGRKNLVNHILKNIELI